MVTEVEETLNTILGQITTVQELKSTGKLVEEHFG